MPTKTADVVRWENTTSNGRIPLTSLRKIEPYQFDFDLRGAARLYPPAASAMSALLADARRAGHFFRVKYSYRTIAVQWIKWRLFGSPRAAYPGTSNHGDARSCDLTNLTAGGISWLRANAHRYGFYNDVWYENWHWTYYGGWKGDEMTEAERRRLATLENRLKVQKGRIDWLEAERTRILLGIEDFLAKKTAVPLLARPTRRKVFQALRRAARLPVLPEPPLSADPDPEEGPEVSLPEE